MERRHVPALRDLVTEGLRDRLKAGPAGQIVQLVRVRFQVIELVRVWLAVNKLVAPTADHQGRGDRALEQHLAVDRIRPVVLLASHQRDQAASIDSVGHTGRPAGGQFDKRWQDIHQRDVARHAPRRKPSWRRDDQRHASGPLEEVHLVPEPALAQHLAMVRGKHDDRVLGQAGRVERVQELTDLIVDVADLGVVGVARPAHPFIRLLVAVEVADMAHAPAVRIDSLKRQIGHRRHVNRVVRVAVPVLLRDGKRVVRVRERDEEEEGALLPSARQLVDLSHGMEGDLVVEVQLVRRQADAGLHDAEHVVIPGRAMVRPVPVRRPAEIGRVDVGREALLEAMQLIGADEVHLTAQAGVVALVAEIVAERRDRGGEFGGIIVPAIAGWQLPCDERGARRRAQWAVAVGALEEDAPLGETGQVRGLHDRVAIDRQRRRGHLVRHNEDDIGSLCGGWGHDPPRVASVVLAGMSILESYMKCRRRDVRVRYASYISSISHSGRIVNRAGPRV